MSLTELKHSYLVFYIQSSGATIKMNNVSI